MVPVLHQGPLARLTNAQGADRRGTEMTGTRSLVLAAGVIVLLLAVAVGMPGDTGRTLLAAIGTGSLIAGVITLRRSLDAEGA